MNDSNFTVISDEQAIRLKKLENALTKSVELQSHYASLLNDYDGGKRLTFANSEEWIERLEVVESINKKVLNKAK